MELNVLPNHVTLPLLAVVMLLGNGTLIVLILRNKRLRTATNLVIASLATSDLLMGILMAPMLVAVEEGMFGESQRTCLAVYCLTVSQILVSCLLLMAIAVERYLAVSRPFKHHAYFTTTNAMLVIGACWLYSFVVGSLPLFGWNAIDNPPPSASPLKTSAHGYYGDNVVDAMLQQQLRDVNQSLPPLPPCLLFLQQRSLHTDVNSTLLHGVKALGDAYRKKNKFECRFHKVMRGSYVAFVYPSHFIPLWVLMTVLYARIYCRSRGPLHDFESTSELRLSRGILPPHPTPRHHFNNNNNNNNNSSSAFATDTGATSRCRRRNSCDDITIIKPRPLVNGVGNGHNSAVQLTSSHNTPDSPHPTLTRGDTSSATVINLASDTDVRAEGQGQRDVLTDAETGRQHAEAAETQQHQRDHVKHQLHHSYQVTRRKENWHAARILALLVGFFVLSWSPLVLWYFTLFRAFTVEYATEVEPLLPRWMYNVGVCMVFANSAVNPFLYGLGNRSVRRAWLQSFRCWYSRRTDLDYFRRLGNADSKPTLFNYATTTFAGSVSVSGARTYVQLPSHRLASQGALRRNDRSISNCVDSSCAKDAADWLRQSRGSTAGAGRCSFQATSLASTDND